MKIFETNVPEAKLSQTLIGIAGIFVLNETNYQVKTLLLDFWHFSNFIMQDLEDHCS